MKLTTLNIAIVLFAITSCEEKKISASSSPVTDSNQGMPAQTESVAEVTHTNPVPVLAKKTWPESASVISQNLDKVINSTEDNMSAAKRALFANVRENDDFTLMCEVASPGDRDLLKILYYTEQSIGIGETDGSLGSKFSDNQIVKDIVELYDAERVASCFVGLENYSSDQLKKIINTIVSVPMGGSYLPEGAPGTTWASRRLQTAMQNIRLAELAKRSIVVRLVAEDSKIMPTTADAVFDWSNATTIKIDIALAPFGEKDVTALQRVSVQSKDEFLKTAAVATLKALGK